MADSKTAQEPSMEEILSSIRRIIAEDEPEGVDGQRGAADGGADAGRIDPDDEDDDVLELTEVVGEPEPVAAPVKATAPAPTLSPSQSVPVADMLESTAMPAQAVELLISPTAASASTNAFARLTRAVATDDRGPTARRRHHRRAAAGRPADADAARLARQEPAGDRRAGGRAGGQEAGATRRADVTAAPASSLTRGFTPPW